ncbi:hypothetical protein JCM3774_005397 [Rhodotorula dairenensis]
MSRRRPSAATADALGLVESTPYAGLAALFTHAFLTVAFLVFINASSPFVLRTTLAARVPAGASGSATSRLLLADELTALSLYLPIGALSDSAEWGLKRCTVAGYVVVAAALAAYVRAPSLNWLIAARVVFAVGGSTLVTTMSALLLQMSAIPDEVVYGTTSPPLGSVGSAPTEESRLLNDSARRTGATTSSSTWGSARSFRKSSRSAGVLAFAGGLGAVVAVFGFLRLPTLFARLSPAGDADSPEALRFGLRATFHTLAAIAILQAGFLACALPATAAGAAFEQREGPERSFKAAMRETGAKLIRGFKLGAQDGNIAVGYASSFASRAQTTVTNAFLPLLIERYFSKYHLCDVEPTNPLGSPTQVLDRDSCRRAYLLASALTGVVQLLSLVLSPVVGYAASSSSLMATTTTPMTIRAARHPQAAVLGLASLIGAVSFVGYSALPHDGDPRSGLAWVYATGVGIAQAAGVVLSLALVTTGRGIVVSSTGGAGAGAAAAAADPAIRGREIAGTLSGAYGFSGGLGILVVGASAGFGFDQWPGAPFALMAAIDLVVVVGAAMLYRRS